MIDILKRVIRILFITRNNSIRWIKISGDGKTHAIHGATHTHRARERERTTMLIGKKLSCVEEGKDGDLGRPRASDEQDQ